MSIGGYFDNGETIWICLLCALDYCPRAESDKRRDASCTTGMTGQREVLGQKGKRGLHPDR